MNSLLRSSHTPLTTSSHLLYSASSSKRVCNRSDSFNPSRSTTTLPTREFSVARLSTPFAVPNYPTRDDTVTSQVPRSYRLLLDRLGKLASNSAAVLDSGASFRDLCVQHRGPSCLSDPSNLPHPTSVLLQRLRKTGAPSLQASPPWSLEQLDAAVLRGAHRSTFLHSEFLREEFADMVEAGQWIVLPYRCVRQLENLRLSPTGVVPQKNRRPRPIVDYTFYQINQACLSLAPDSLQFGHALNRLLQRLHLADTRRGRIYMSKTDIADAFMRVWIQAGSIPTLGAILPQSDGEEPLIAFPMILPMGWIESPNYLCAVTETIADLTNHRLTQNHLSTVPHRLDEWASTFATDNNFSAIVDGSKGPESLAPPTIRSRGPLQRPLSTVDVFMDDFIMLTQLPLQDRVAARRTLFECIDAVLRPLASSDNPCRKEPNSVKKLAQGDASWSTKKVILGWLVDTVQRTIELPVHRIERLRDLLDGILPNQRRTSRHKWQCLLGELRSMVLAIPGGRGLFSQLQSTLTYSPNAKPSDRLALSPAVHDQLDDLRWLTTDLRSRPTRWGEIVDSAPTFFGAVDASGTGMGGVWIPTNPAQSPLLWRSKFADSISAALVTFDNPSGTLTNSDLEQAGLVCLPDILAQVYDVREHTICALSDNTAAISREQRGSTSVDAPSSYLCRLSSLHQRAFRYRLRSSYLPGPLNVMADTLSRRPTLATLPAATVNALQRDASAIEEAMQRGRSKGRLTTANTYEGIWADFCQQYQLDPLLADEAYPIAWVQIFAEQIRDGRLSASRKPVRSKTVADAIQLVAQTFTIVDAPDPRMLKGTQTVNPHLKLQLKGYAKDDPSPGRVKPIPLPILHRAAAIATAANDETSLAIADMMWLAFFFLLRPGEYTQPAEDSHPFHIADVRLWRGSTAIDCVTGSIDDLLNCTFVSLVFTTQKNGTLNEVIGHGATDNPAACPVRAVVRRILYLRRFQAPPTTFLCAVGSSLRPLTSSGITQLLQQACVSLGNPSGYKPTDISAKSLRASGAMALLNGGVEHEKIQLIGRWKSDSSLRYLHVQAHNLMNGFSSRMLQGGNYNLIPATPNTPLPPFT